MPGAWEELHVVYVTGNVCKILASPIIIETNIYQSDRKRQAKDALQAGGRRFDSVYLHNLLKGNHQSVMTKWLPFFIALNVFYTNIIQNFGV